jgi:branched-chain amino acid transport system permease protein
MSYLLTLLLLFTVSTIVALSLNILVGYCGMLTMAHSAFFALGAYSYALLSMRITADLFVTAAIAAIVAFAFSTIISLPAWRFRGDFFVIMSLAAQSVLFGVLNNFYRAGEPVGSWHNLTNGPLGIAGIPRPSIFGLPADSLAKATMLAVGVAIAIGIVIRRLVVSPWGRVLLSMRDDDLATRSLGKSVRRAKVAAVGFACAFAAIAGVLHAGYFSYIEPSLASLDRSIVFLSMVMIGGSGNFRGPIAGAAFLTVLPEILRWLRVSGPQIGHVQLACYGLLLILIVHLRPQGLAGNYRVE